LLLLLLLLLLLFIIYIVNLPVVRPRSCRVIYYFDTHALGRRHQSFGHVREQEHDLDLKTNMLKCMANASFYRPKFGTIDLKTNCLVGGHLLTW